MIQLLILFFVVVFIIAIIMLYKKYIRIKNVVDEELDRKYNKVKKAVGSNNKQIKQLKKDASELINTPNNDTNTLQEKINNNRDKIAENRVEMVDNNFQEINKVFKYESGFIVGGNAGQLRIGSDNIQLNVPNPVQVRVCDEQSCDSDIFTKRNTEDSIPVVINENVDSGVDESKNGNVPVVVTSADGNLEFNNDTKIFSSSKNIKSIQFNSLWGKSDIEDVVPNTYLFDMAKMYNPQYNLITTWQYLGPMAYLSEGDSVSGNLFAFNQNVIDSSSQEIITIEFVKNDGTVKEIQFNINISNGEVTSITSS